MAHFSNTLFDLSGKSAVITGASRGIGEAIARRLAQHGADVLVSSRKLDACEKVALAINEETGRSAAIAAACNISRKEDLQGLVNKAVSAFGKIDILVSNAAVNPYYGPSSGISDEQFDKILTANVKASHWLSPRYGGKEGRRLYHHLVHRRVSRQRRYRRIRNLQGGGFAARAQPCRRVRTEQHPRQLHLPRHRQDPFR